MESRYSPLIIYSLRSNRRRGRRLLPKYLFHVLHRATSLSTNCHLLRTFQNLTSNFSSRRHVDTIATNHSWARKCRNPGTAYLDTNGPIAATSVAPFLLRLQHLAMHPPVSLRRGNPSLPSPVSHYQRSSHCGTGTLILAPRFQGRCAKDR